MKRPALRRFIRVSGLCAAGAALAAGVVSATHAATAATTSATVTAPVAGMANPANAGNLLQVAFSLFVVLILMGATAWAIKRYGPKRLLGEIPVKIVGGVSLGGRERVLVIEVADQWIVVGTAPGRVNTLATMPRQIIEAAPDAPGAPNFAAWLKQTIDKRNSNNSRNNNDSNNNDNLKRNSGSDEHSKP
jgi:flagellar protein FliO/FliZ